MDGVPNPRRIIVQRKPTMYSQMLNKGQFVEGEAQWRIGWTFWT